MRNIAPTPLLRSPDDRWQLADPVEVGVDTRDALNGAIRALCPLDLPDVAAIPDVLERVQDHVLRSMRYMHPIPALGLRISLLLLDWAPLALLKAPCRLQDLEPRRAEHIIASIEHGRWLTLSKLAAGVRASVSLAFYDLPEVHTLIGYEPTPFMRDRVALRRRLLAGESATASDMLTPSEDTLLQAAALSLQTTANARAPDPAKTPDLR